MKNQKKSIIYVLLLLAINPAKSQNLIMGGIASLGLSKVSSNLPISGDYKVKFNLSGNLGMFLEKKISSNFYLGIEAKWVQIEGKEVTKDKALTFSSGQTIGVISDKSKLHSSYIGVPFYHRITIRKVGIIGGIQPMIFLFASSNYKANGIIDNKPYKAESSRKDIKFDRIDIGPKIGIDYLLNGKLRLRADYYHGLTDITSEEFPWQRRNRQLSLGVNYFFSFN